MPDLEPHLQEISVLNPFVVALVGLAGLVVGIAPSSYPLISFAADPAAGGQASETSGGAAAGLARRLETLPRFRERTPCGY
jgi:hypothetical protein